MPIIPIYEFISQGRNFLCFSDSIIEKQSVIGSGGCSTVFSSTKLSLSGNNIEQLHNLLQLQTQLAAIFFSDSDSVNDIKKSWALYQEVAGVIEGEDLLTNDSSFYHNTNEIPGKCREMSDKCREIIDAYNGKSLMRSNNTSSCLAHESNNLVIKQVRSRITENGCNHDIFQREATLSTEAGVKCLCCLTQRQQVILIQPDLGESLAAQPKAKTLPIMEKIEQAIKLCQNLQSIHEKSIFHGDIKPHNICGDKIIDYGLARKENLNEQYKEDQACTMSYMPERHGEFTFAELDICNLLQTFFGNKNFKNKSQTKYTFTSLFTEKEIKCFDQTLQSILNSNDGLAPATLPSSKESCTIEDIINALSASKKNIVSTPPDSNNIPLFNSFEENKTGDTSYVDLFQQCRKFVSRVKEI